MTKTKELVSNRKASLHYEILETYEAGMVLKGTEVKSLRNRSGSLQEAYVRIINKELWLIDSYIAPYNFGNLHNHEEKRKRKLLMHFSEIRKLKSFIKEKGQVLIPLSWYLKNGHIKLKIARAIGKKKADKRQAIKDRDDKRRLQQATKTQVRR